MADSALMERPTDSFDENISDSNSQEEKLSASYLEKDDEEILSHHFLETPKEAEEDRLLLESMYAQDAVEPSSPKDSGRTARFKSDAKRKPSPLSNIEGEKEKSPTGTSRSQPKSMAKIKREKQAKIILIITCIILMIGCILGILYKYDVI